MDQPIFTASLLAAGSVLAVVAQWRGWRPSLRTALAVGIGLRLVLLVTAANDSWQPVDFVLSFKPAGEAVLAGQDPVLATEGAWHFLPMIPYLYAAGLAVGLPWEIAGRLVTVAADVVLIVLVGRLAGASRELSRFQYACNPIALMVSVIHSQVEPVALVFLVAAYLCARSSRGIAAGALLGLALSAKSWPVIVLPVVLAMLPTWRHRCQGLVAAGAVPLMFLLTLPLIVNVSWARLMDIAGYLGGVRPIVGEWGWTAWMTGGNWELAPAPAKIGQIVLYITLAVVAWAWRRADPVDQTAAMLLAFMIVTPRMAAQYLLWFVPFLIARPTRWSGPAMAAAATWAGLGYIFLTQFDYIGWARHHSWWAMSSAAVIPLLALAMPWARRRPSRPTVTQSPPQPELAAVT
ncbi:glycosyltransferase 87 family protein [Actinomadura alba]|uniref:DUF2029 domain-containing protein n=1 Tax=Actinomadura alba TaxID=406431 RepID=A0ABR7LXS0_9ACTN|nr:glycosyltransferase 87 family protein [Actinomadura alba]MBC6469255.1 DUF2029 domain-containing protein [Actinomadura alba]